MSAGRIWSSRLARRRIELGLSQEQLAALIGVKQSAISKIERGTISVTDDRLRQFAAVLKIAPRDLVEAIDARQAQPARVAPPAPKSDPIRDAVDRALSRDGSALDRTRAAIAALRKIEDLLVFAEVSQ